MYISSGLITVMPDASRYSAFAHVIKSCWLHPGAFFIPSEFDQLSPGLGNIKVPIINDETGDVVFLGMGDINFQQQFSGLEGEDNSNKSSSPEQLTLKGQEGIAIDLGSGEFFEPSLRLQSLSAPRKKRQLPSEEESQSSLAPNRKQ